MSQTFIITSIYGKLLRGSQGDGYLSLGYLCLPLSTPGKCLTARHQNRMLWARDCSVAARQHCTTMEVTFVSMLTP